MRPSAETWAVTLGGLDCGEQLGYGAHMTTTNLEIAAFSLFEQHAATKGFWLKATPTIDTLTKLWRFTFMNGREVRVVQLFEEDIIKDTSAGMLSDDTKRKIDGELSV